MDEENQLTMDVVDGYSSDGTSHLENASVSPAESAYAYALLTTWDDQLVRLMKGNAEFEAFAEKLKDIFDTLDRPSDEGPESDDGSSNEGPDSDLSSDTAPETDRSSDDAPASDRSSGEAPESDQSPDDAPKSDRSPGEAAGGDRSSDEAPASDRSSEKAPESDRSSDKAPESDRKRSAVRKGSAFRRLEREHAPECDGTPNEETTDGAEPEVTGLKDNAEADLMAMGFDDSESESTAESEIIWLDEIPDVHSSNVEDGGSNCSPLLDFVRAIFC